MRVVDLAIGVERLINLRLFGLLDVNNHKPVFARSDVSVGASQIKIVRVGQRHNGALNDARLFRQRDIHDLQAFRVGHERVTELHLNRSRFPEAAQDCDQPRLQRIVEIDDGQSLVASDVGVDARDGDVRRAVERAAGIERQRAFQEVVRRIAVEQRRYAGLFVADDDKSLVLVADIKEGIDRMDRLFVITIFGLLIFGPVFARRINGQRRRRSDSGRVFRINVKSLTERRDRRGRDAFAEAFVVNVGDVVNAQAAGAIGDVGVFAAHLNAERLVMRGVFVGFDKAVFAFDVFFVLFGVSQLVQTRPDDCLRLVAFGHDYGVDAVFARRDPGEPPDEVDEVRPLHQQLRHDRVVVAGLGHVAIGADFRFGRADGVRHESAERVAAVTFG
ncbi:MAG: hypothetical protein JMDDDDMK_03879 [Acidobacteria bacterium]|nr:hypothetical protein [Acidobacteriota bacterium]